MTNDAKLGLVLGVAIVLVIALVFFRHDALLAKTPADQGFSKKTPATAQVFSANPSPGKMEP
jgi:hypothetical protein